MPVGTKQNLAGFTREQMQKWYADQVMQGRRVIAVYGDIELEKARSVASERVGGGEKLKGIAPPSAEQSAPTKGAPRKASIEIQRVELNKTEQPLAGVFIGFDAASYVGAPANFPLDVADTMSSGYHYPTGYIFETLRGRGLVYMADAQNWPGRSKEQPGAFFAYAGCDPGNVNDVVDLILQNVARLQSGENDSQPGWFDRSKQLLTTYDAIEHETPAAQAQTAALDELMGLGYDYHEQFVPKINSVTFNDVRQTAAHRLSRCVITVSTPAPDTVKIEPGTRTYDSFPPVDLTPRGVQHDQK
jgi:zinc protease